MGSRNYFRESSTNDTEAAYNAGWDAGRKTGYDEGYRQAMIDEAAAEAELIRPPTTSW